MSPLDPRNQEVPKGANAVLARLSEEDGATHCMTITAKGCDGVRKDHLFFGTPLFLGGWPVF